VLCMYVCRYIHTDVGHIRDGGMNNVLELDEENREKFLPCVQSYFEG
jgi:hypothetical protein